MPTARASRRIEAPVEELWELVSDPHHLPRWWPRVSSVEDVEPGAFTEVMRTAKGKIVRADFNVLGADEAARTVTWRQRIEGTPFARVLSSAETQLTLIPAPDPAGTATGAAAGAAGDAFSEEPRVQDGASGADGLAAATDVTIELRHTLTGFFPRFGGWMVRRAAAATIDEALDGLERISG